MSDVKFLNGLLAKAPNDKAPDFVKCNLSIKRAELITTLAQMTDEWVNVQVKESKGGKWYAAIDDWKPEQKNDPAQHASGNRNQANPTYEQAAPSGTDDFEDDLIPF